MKKNIVNRNKDTTFKQNKQFNSNNSKIKLSPCKNLNKEYYNSIDKELIKYKNLNDNIKYNIDVIKKNKPKNRNRNNSKGEIFYNFGKVEFNKNYFISEK